MQVNSAFIATTIVVGMVIGAIGLPASAQAKTIAIQPSDGVLQNGKTVVPRGIFQACVGDVVQYRSNYEEIDLVGNFWVKTHSDRNCTGNGGRMTGYYEERSLNGKKFCRGQMTIEVNGRGYYRIQWNTVNAVPGYICLGFGRGFSMLLNYVPGRK